MAADLPCPRCGSSTSEALLDPCEHCGVAGCSDCLCEGGDVMYGDRTCCDVARAQSEVWWGLGPGSWREVVCGG